MAVQFLNLNSNKLIFRKSKLKHFKKDYCISLHSSKVCIVTQSIIQQFYDYKMYRTQLREIKCLF